MNRSALRDPRFWLISAALLFLVSTFAAPHITRMQDVVRILVVVDVTGSMNTRDYGVDGHPESRLDAVRRILTDVMARLPCKSSAGLGVFTERRAFLLFDPIEVCENFAPLAGSIDALSWRMAWEGDSHIATGLYSGVDLAASLGADLIFMTDGQEAPPLPWNGGPPFEGKPGAVKGVIVGVGGYSLSPIPKFDENGRDIGFYGPEDVAQDNRLGLPPPDAEAREGYNPRNAPFGAKKAVGNEQLSSVHESYLKELAAKTGLTYTHLVDAASLTDAIRDAATPHPTPVVYDLRPLLAALALAMLVAAYGLAPFLANRRRTGAAPGDPKTEEPHWRIAA